MLLLHSHSFSFTNCNCRQEQQLLQTTQQPVMMQTPTPAPQFNPNLTTNVPTNAYNPIATNVPAFSSPMSPLPVPHNNPMMTMSSPVPSSPVPGGMGMPMNSPMMTMGGMGSPVPGGGLYPNGMMATSNPQLNTMYPTNYSTNNFNTYNQTGGMFPHFSVPQNSFKFSVPSIHVPTDDGYDDLPTTTTTRTSTRLHLWQVEEEGIQEGTWVVRQKAISTIISAFNSQTKFFTI